MKRDIKIDIKVWKQRSACLKNTKKGEIQEIQEELEKNEVGRKKINSTEDWYIAEVK